MRQFLPRGRSGLIGRPLCSWCLWSWSSRRPPCGMGLDGSARPKPVTVPPMRSLRCGCRCWFSHLFTMDSPGEAPKAMKPHITNKIAQQEVAKIERVRCAMPRNHDRHGTVRPPRSCDENPEPPVTKIADTFVTAHSKKARPPKGDRPMSTAERVRAHRARKTPE